MGVEDLTIGQWAYLLGLGVIGMVLHALWAHREAVWAWAAPLIARLRPATAPHYVAQTDDLGQTDRPDRPDRQTDRVCLVDLEPLTPERDIIIPPGDRAALIQRLVAEGWGVGQIRGVLKGDSGRIGEEVAAAQAGAPPAPEPAPAAPRLITISGGRGGYIALDEDDPPEPLP